MTAETLILVKAPEAYFWIAILLSGILYCKPSDDKKIKNFPDNLQLHGSLYSIRCIQGKCLQTEITLLTEMINKKGTPKIFYNFPNVIFIWLCDRR